MNFLKRGRYGQEIIAVISSKAALFYPPPSNYYFLFAVFIVAQAVATAAVAVDLPEKTAVMASPNGPQ